MGGQEVPLGVNFSQSRGKMPAQISLDELQAFLGGSGWNWLGGKAAIKALVHSSFVSCLELPRWLNRRKPL